MCFDNCGYAVSPRTALNMHRNIVLIHQLVTFDVEVKISKTFLYRKLKHFRMFVLPFISFKFNAWKDFVLFPNYLFPVVAVMSPS